MVVVVVVVVVVVYGQGCASFQKLHGTISTYMVIISRSHQKSQAPDSSKPYIVRVYILLFQLGKWTIHVISESNNNSNIPKQASAVILSNICRRPADIMVDYGLFCRVHQ